MCIYPISINEFYMVSPLENKHAFKIMLIKIYLLLDLCNYLAFVSWLWKYLY